MGEPAIAYSPRARILDVTEDEYHADPCAAPSLSASIATLLVDRSPLHAWQAHPKLGGVRRAPTAAMDRGTLIHKLLLGKGAEAAIIDAPDYRTKKAQQQRDDARGVGKAPVLASLYSDALATAGVLLKRLADFDVTLGGESEVVVTWEEDSPHGPVTCRGMFDHLEGDVIYDLKTSRSAHPRACSRHVVEYGYDVQHAAYLSALEALRPELQGRAVFVHLFVELEPPFGVYPCRLDGVLREYGERRWGRAVETWAKCLATNEWPGYSPGIEWLAAPSWLLARMQEEDDGTNV